MLVTGATGYIGSRLIAHLLREDVDVVATARDVDSLARFDYAEQVHAVALDTTDADSCTRAFAEAGPVDVAYYFVHAIGSDDFAEQDLRSAQNFGAAAAAAGVRRLVYLGGFVPDGEELSEHLDSRADVGDALARSGVPTVWLRAAVILGAGSTSYELVRAMAERLPVIPLPSWMNHVVAPIAVDDVLHYLHAAMSNTLPAGSYNISCGEGLSYSDLIRRYVDVRGLRRWWLPVYGITPAMAAPVAARLVPVPSDLVADLVKSLANTMSSDDSRISRYVDVPAGGLTDITTALRRAQPPAGYTPLGVLATKDPLLLTATDPDWAGQPRR